MKQRDSYIDILKAIGIVSVVAGHSGWTLTRFGIMIGPFVYTYHLMIFLFVPGMCYNAKKYSGNSFAYIGGRIRGLLPSFVGYSAFFILIHNLLRRLHFISQEFPVYSVDDMLVNLGTAFTFKALEQLLGPFWFVSVILFGTGFFAMLFSFAEKQQKPLLFHLLFVLISGGLGLYLCSHDLSIDLHMQIAVLGIPVIYLGYLFQQNRDKLMRFCPFWGFIPTGALLYWIITRGIGIIELSVNSIINPVLFYPVTVLGLYFVLCVGNLVNKIGFLRMMCSYIGRNSFHIMALHVLCLKLVDLVYVKTHGLELEVLEAFPHSFQFGPIYYLAGVFLPLIFIEGLRLVKRGCRKILKFS